jgi:hypothetical protein
MTKVRTEKHEVKDGFAEVLRANAATPNMVSLTP